MKKFRITIGDKTYNVEVGDPRQSPMTVVVDGEEFRVEVQAAPASDDAQADLDHPAIPSHVAGGSGGPSRVTAPMPGTILNIEAQVGDQVQKGQVLCALEAMKMKSPIRAHQAGTVRQVQVQEGQTVDHDDLLFVGG